MTDNVVKSQQEDYPGLVDLFKLTVDRRFG